MELKEFLKSLDWCDVDLNGNISEAIVSNSDYVKYFGRLGAFYTDEFFLNVELDDNMNYIITYY